MKLNRGYIMAKFDMELDDNFISKLFELTDACPPSGDDLNLQALKKQLYELGVILYSNCYSKSTRRGNV